MEKKKKVQPNHTVTFSSKSTADTNETKGGVESPNGCVFISALAIIAIVVILIAVMFGLTFFGK
jgi:hypothetical protein